MPTAVQALARHYPGAVFLRLNGSANPGAKSLFKDRLKCRATPAFFYFRHGGWLGGQSLFYGKFVI